jgi:hypothetical protein
MRRGCSESWIRCKIPTSISATGLVKSRVPAAARRMTEASRRPPSMYRVAPCGLPASSGRRLDEG